MSGRSLKRARAERGDILTNLPPKRAHHGIYTTATSTVAVSATKNIHKPGVFPFFRLSNELRNQIYEHVVDDLTADLDTHPIALKVCRYMLWDPLDSRKRVREILNTAAGLGHASSRLRNEFWPLLWSRAKFCLCHCTLPHSEDPPLLYQGVIMDIGKLMELPPMITGPRELGCGRITRMAFLWCRPPKAKLREWVAAPYGLTEQLVAVLMKLEFRGEVEVNCMCYELALFREMLDDAVARVCSGAATSLKDAMNAVRRNTRVQDLLHRHMAFMQRPMSCRHPGREIVHYTALVNFSRALESHHADVEPHDVPHFLDRNDYMIL
ncbi:hypothetical protein GTA08_BOTSDO13785 [Neofusicoccum parvum]|nr:hypothetical protein GTA08_BOTSDO13785 [Neofusicoccum parvum]